MYPEHDLRRQATRFSDKIVLKPRPGKSLFSLSVRLSTRPDLFVAVGVDTQRTRLAFDHL
jgi:hypothetical protein